MLLNNQFDVDLIWLCVHNLRRTPAYTHKCEIRCIIQLASSPNSYENLCHRCFQETVYLIGYDIIY